jgi:hypothetical protein
MFAFDQEDTEPRISFPLYDKVGDEYFVSDCYYPDVGRIPIKLSIGESSSPSNRPTQRAETTGNI